MQLTLAKTSLHVWRLAGSSHSNVKDAEYEHLEIEDAGSSTADGSCCCLDTSLGILCRDQIPICTFSSFECLTPARENQCML